jgi:hypothetical protein
MTIGGRADALRTPGRTDIVNGGRFSKERLSAATAGICDHPWSDVMRRPISMPRQTFVTCPVEVNCHKDADHEDQDSQEDFEEHATHIRPTGEAMRAMGRMVRY